MIRRIRQLFCRHRHMTYHADDYGHYATCNKCGKREEMFMGWV